MPLLRVTCRFVLLLFIAGFITMAFTLKAILDATFGIFTRLPFMVSLLYSTQRFVEPPGFYIRDYGRHCRYRTAEIRSIKGTLGTDLLKE